MSIASEIERLQTAKTDLKTAIEAKGVEVADTDTIDAYANKVNMIESGGVNHSDYINPEWTNWDYFCRYRDSLVSKIKYEDTSNGTSFIFAFSYTNVPEIPFINTSKGTVFSSMFQGCKSIITIPEINTSNGTLFSNMFDSCTSLISVPELNMSKATNVQGMFVWCGKLTTINSIELTNCTQPAVFSIFSGCASLVYIRFKGTIPRSITFQQSPLDSASAKDVISHLVNYAGTDKEFAYTVTFSPTTWSYLDAEGETASPNGNSWREYINDLGWNAS